MEGRLVAEALPGRMGLDLLLREPHHLAWSELQAVQSDAARIDPIVVPALVALAQVEELAGRVAVAVEIDLERRLLGSGQRPRQVARALQQVVQARGELRIVNYLRCDLRADITRVRHRLARLPRTRSL